MTDLLGKATHLQARTPEVPDWQQWQRARADRARERVNFYRSLSPAQGKELALAALHLVEDGENTDYLAEQILTKLANIVPGSLHGLHPLFLERDIHWGDKGLYREADLATRDYIIALLESDDIVEMLQSHRGDIELRQDLLASLAWIGDEHVQRQFLKWRETPPPWSVSRAFEKPLDAYTHYAGWELTENGKKRELYFQQCYELIPVEEAPAEDIPGPISVIGSHEERCAWCGRQLLTLFDFNLSDFRFDFFRLRGKRLRIALCASCSIFDTEPPFFDVDMYGASHWSEWNDTRDAFEEDESISLSPSQLVLAQRRRTPFETNASYSQSGLSQIGGHPEWVHFPQYPRCLSCQQTMMFVGQFEPMDILADAEGMIYAFLCAECGGTTTRFQCT
jgi:hypothetical protein